MAADRHIPGLVRCFKTETILLHAKITGGGNGVTCTVEEPFEFGSIISSITYAAEGDYDIVFTEKFPQLVGLGDPCVVSATADRKVQWTAIDVAAGTASILATTAGVAADLTTSEDVYLTLIVRNRGTLAD